MANRGAVLGPRELKIPHAVKERLETLRQPGQSLTSVLNQIQKGKRPEAQHPAIARLSDIPAATLSRIQQHIVWPMGDTEFYPLLLYKGHLRIGHARALLNFFTANQELETPTFDAMVQQSSISTGHRAKDWESSPLGHLTGIHAHQTPSLTIKRFASRLARCEAILKQFPHLEEYIYSLVESSGESLPTLESISRWSSNRLVETGGRSWRYKPAPARKRGRLSLDAGHIGPLETVAGVWPFLSDERKQDDSADMLSLIDAAVPKGIPQSTREDLCQDLVVAILSGELDLKNINDVMEPFIKGAFKQSPTKYGNLSLERPLTADGFTLQDILGGQTKSVGLCDRCEKYSDSLDFNVCPKCYQILEHDIQQESFSMSRYQATIPNRRAKHSATGTPGDYEVEHEDFYADNDSLPVLAFEESVPTETIEYPHDGHDSNRRTKKWEGENIPYIDNERTPALNGRTKARGGRSHIRKMYKEMKSKE